MKARIRKYEEESPVEVLLLRQRLGLKRYRKTARRDEGEKKLLVELGLRKIEREKRTILFR